MVRTLLVNNYDSFTYNLFQMLAEVNGTEPVVVDNDDFAAWDRVDLDGIDNIVISPGPGRPERDRDFGLGHRALGLTHLPVLGVCLGHEGLCHRYGAGITHAPEPMHGRLSPIHHAGGPLFEGIPSPFAAVRYHSLIVDGLPDVLERIAWTPEGLLMGARHRHHPHWGVQFHPESIATEHGRRLLSNFRDLSIRSRPRARAPHVRRPERRLRSRPGAPGHATTAASYELVVETVADVPDTEQAFDALAAHAAVIAWLDSSSVVQGLSRYSVLGLPSEEGGEVVTYEVATGEVTVTRLDGTPIRVGHESIFDHLERELERRRVDDAGLPFEFNLGYIGYLGYELKADCGARAAHTSPLPDAGLVFCDRALVVDHVTGKGWLLGLATPASVAATRTDLQRMAQVLRRLAADPARRALTPAALASASEPLAYDARHSPAAYGERIAACLRAIADGESYEVCLTNMLTVPFEADAGLAYRVLRRVNPAPYAALLQLRSFSVLSSSPERFLTIDRHGAVESKPIKGTRARSSDPAEDAALARELQSSEKDRAENLMIVDLVRNDLGRTAEVGSVHVPHLFAIESFSSVHQLVSTVRSQLRAGVSPVRCVQEAFPGGSMTGAPKLRTMEIIDGLEDGPRGVYSGALGFFSLNGAVDLSIVIRTMVLSHGQARIGTGGAIVSLSSPDAEIEETMIKAAPLLRAVQIAAALDQRRSAPSGDDVPAAMHGGVRGAGTAL